MIKLYIKVCAHAFARNIVQKSKSKLKKEMSKALPKDIKKFSKGNQNEQQYVIQNSLFRGAFRTTATPKMKHFFITVNGFQLLTVITKSSILDVATFLDPPLLLYKSSYFMCSIFSEKRGFESNL